MRSTALFTLVLVGTAAAQPRQEETSGRVSYTEKASQRDAPRRSDEWVQLATPTPASHGTEFVIVGKDAGYFSQLRVDADKGKTIVRKLKVFFADGGVKVVELDRAIDAKRQKSVNVELGASRAIDRVVITTETHTNGTYAIYGSSGGEVVKR